LNTYFKMITLALLTTPVIGQVNPQSKCDPYDDPCIAEERLVEQRKNIYPFKPVATEEIDTRLSKLTESDKYINDIREMNARGLLSRNTKDQPWGGSYWPLYQGQIANPYQEIKYKTLYGTFSGLRMLSFDYNYSTFKRRKKKILNKVLDLSEEQLARLAPSEKYDLLLGDYNFDLTHRIWDFAKNWNDNSKWAYLASINIPSGYRIPRSVSGIKMWEGICHGWAVASGSSERAEKTVWTTLPNGKKMPFYPNDVKALVTLMWANSTIQDSMLVEGLRCNDKKPKKDEFGRYIDTRLDKTDKDLLPRCADVHPAVYHTSIVNVLGVEGRSFVIDKAAEVAVSNQPVSGYEYTYFNPSTGEDADFNNSALKVSDYTNDPFASARNKDTKYIVGVSMTLKYVNWENPIKFELNAPSDDKIIDKKFNYDLELDANFKIIGGQWRVSKDGSPKFFNNETNQPDFFWIVPKNYKSHFANLKTIPQWDFKQSTVPPKEYKAAAKQAHAFIYRQTKEYGWDLNCTVKPIKRGSGPDKEVPCEFRFPQPQPLVNVVNTLLEQSIR